ATGKIPVERRPDGLAGRKSVGRLPLLAAGKKSIAKNQESFLLLAQDLAFDQFDSEVLPSTQDRPELVGGLHFSPVDRRVGGHDAEPLPIGQATIDRTDGAQELS